MNAIHTWAQGGGGIELQGNGARSRPPAIGIGGHVGGHLLHHIEQEEALAMRG